MFREQGFGKKKKKKDKKTSGLTDTQVLEDLEISGKGGQEVSQAWVEEMGVGEVITQFRLRKGNKDEVICSGKGDGILVFSEKGET